MKIGSIIRTRWIFRVWYYFRLGYGTYLTFLLGYVSTLVTVYYLAIKNLPPLLDIFPHFALFAVVATVIGVPLAVAVGWVHMKRSWGYASEMDVGVEANPYYYKLPPGYSKEAYAPLYLELLVQLKRLLDAQSLLTEDDKSRIELIERKMRTLIEGGYVGTPRTRV